MKFVYGVTLAITFVFGHAFILAGILLSNRDYGHDL